MKKAGNVRKSNYVFEYRITVLGNSQSGKTNLIRKFIGEEFVDTHVPTIEDHHQHIVEHDGSMCVCLLLDTCGTFDFPAMKNWCISKGNSFIVVYSILDKKSFQVAKSLIRDIKITKGSTPEIKIMLIGNKTDSENKRQVSKSEGLELAKSVTDGNVTCDFVETSAKEGQNVDEAFHGLLNMFLPEPASPSSYSPSLRRGSLDRTIIRRSLRGRKKSKTPKITRNELLRHSDENLLNVGERSHKGSISSFASTDSGSDSEHSPPMSPSHLQRSPDLSAFSRPRASFSTPPRDKRSFLPFASFKEKRPSLNEAGPIEIRTYSLDSDTRLPQNLTRQSSARELFRRTSSTCKGKLDIFRNLVKRSISEEQAMKKANLSF